MEVYSRILIFSSLLLVAVACNKKEFCDTLEQHDSNVELRYDWSRGCCIPEKVEVRLTASSGEVQSTQTPSKVGYLALLEDTYQVLAYEKCKNVIVEGTVARLQALPDGTLAEPGDFSAGTGYIVLEGGKPYRCTIVMKKQFNALKVSIETNGKDAGSIQRMDAKLSGIALARDMKSNCCIQTRNGGDESGSMGDIKFGMEQKGTSFAGNVKFLGTTEGSKQVIAISMTYEDGSNQTVEMDVTENISTPEDETLEDPKPKEISAGLEVENIKGVFTATITDWNEGSGGDLSADENKK